MGRSSTVREAFSRAQGSYGGNKAKEIETDILRVYGNVLEFKSTFYQISNMSAVEVVPLYHDFPTWALVGFIFGGLVGLVGIGVAALALVVIGGACACIGGYALLGYALKPSDHGLLLLLNAGRGASAIIVSPHREFLLEVARTIADLMNERYSGEIIFNIQNQRIEMSDVTGAVVNNGSGSIGGNVSNSVRMEASG